MITTVTVVLMVLVLLSITMYLYATVTQIGGGGDNIELVHQVRRRSKRSAQKKWEADSTPCNATISSPATVTRAGRSIQACRCHWPTLFGQKDEFSECNVRHACDGGKGSLVHKITRQPLDGATPPIDIHAYECSACDRCNTPGPDPHTGLPSCLPRPLKDRDRDMCLYNVDSESLVYSGHEEAERDRSDYRTVKPMLSVKSGFVEAGYVAAFTDRVRNTAWVPNPCAFDLFTGAVLGDDCELRLTRKSNIAYCAPTKDNIMTAVKEDSYLAGNGGRYPNACFRFASDKADVNAYVVEYFLRKRQVPELPSPVVSMRIAKKNVLQHVLAGLGLTREADDKMLLFTQPEPPADVSDFPHPFTHQRMGTFSKELNNWTKKLPAKCWAAGVGFPILYNCSAPPQALPIPECSKIGHWDRGPPLKDYEPTGGVIGDQTEAYAKSTVACLKPGYDARFPLVPNYNVSVGSTDADPTSAILLFDKSDHTVYPHWKDVGSNVSSGDLDDMRRYLRTQLLSLPNVKL